MSWALTLAILRHQQSYRSLRAPLVAQLVKNLPAMQETWVRSPGWEDALEKGMATHSGILAWRTPWTLPWAHKESDMTEQLSLSLFWHQQVWRLHDH